MVEITRNFLSPAECAELNAWVDLGVANKWLDAGVDRGSDWSYTNRLSTRRYGDRFVYPPLVEQIARRIAELKGLQFEPRATNGGGRNGVVVSCTLPGGDVYEHTDPMEQGGRDVLRCNVMTRAADAGGELHVTGEQIDVAVGDLHCYVASKEPHFVTEVQGETSRVLWMFGWGVKENG